MINKTTNFNLSFFLASASQIAPPDWPIRLPVAPSRGRPERRPPRCWSAAASGAIFLHQGRQDVGAAHPAGAGERLAAVLARKQSAAAAEARAAKGGRLSFSFSRKLSLGRRRRRRRLGKSCATSGRLCLIIDGQINFFAHTGAASGQQPIGSPAAGRIIKSAAAAAPTR